ncbi:MAG: hypothetical protein EOP53_14500 [Sphingobacteriales bacterium]|nr:MAG: hypothetical protein EOP53_14500 [Sphingobacteriales bacterium]
MPKFLLFFFYCFISIAAQAQLTISGSVLDKGKINLVEHVRVVSTGGMFAMTDSMGRYNIMVKPQDSIYFVYNNKPTQKFAVNKIANTAQFDVSIHLFVNSKYSMLKEVVVYSKTYKQDSLENRQTYADVFEYKKPGLSTSITPGGAVGADVNELINMFRFKRNKRLKAFRNRLEAQEEERYINYRFNKIFVGRITGLKSPELDSFMVWFRPSYEFTAAADEIAFNQYILNASYQFKKWGFVDPAKKQDDL